jgi:TadE-like protein
MVARSACRPGRVAAQATVETALVFPLLVLIALGLVQFALYAYDENVVTATAQEAARVAALASDSQFENVANARIGSLLPSSLWGKAAIQSSKAVLSNGGDSVTINIDGSLATYFPWFSFRSGISRLSLPLHANVMVSRERFRGGP